MKLFISICFAAVILSSCDAQKPTPPELIKGISFVATRDTINDAVVQPIKNYNANYVSVHPYGFMRDMENPAVNYNSSRQWWGERLAGTKSTIDIFHSKGLRVMLKPQIWIGRGVYTGTIEMPDESRWDTLAATYERFIMDHAQVAEQTNTEIFCIGTELESFVTARPEYWNDLVKKIRSVYKGKLTYAGNWDSYKHVPFWDQMDYIGIDAYFPVSDQKTPDVATAKAGWSSWMDELSSLSRKHNKKILFAEYGYTSADYAGKEPWKSADETQESNEQAQQQLLQAQYDTIWNQEWFAGGFLWKHHAEQGRRGFDKLFTPQGKIGATTVSEAYSRF
ncbi:glycoside hydrolase family 113 [Nonlabens marinus]|nr:glycoside hydrolase [Nonlabens marinus]